MPHLRKQRRRNGPPATGRQTTDSEKCADRRQRLHRSCFSKKGTPAYGARHHARPCDRLKNNSPQTAGDAFGTDPTVGHRTKLIINYGKNDLPTRKKCGAPRRQPHPHPASPDNPIIASRLRLPPVRTRSPAFFVSLPGGHRLTLAGWQQPERRACRSHRPRQAGRRPGRQQPSGDRGHRATAATTAPASPRSGQAGGYSPRRGPGRRAGRSVRG